jgi:hypothetical protein
MYWVERFTTSKIMKKTKNGEIIKLVEGKFGFMDGSPVLKMVHYTLLKTNKLHRLSPDGKSDSYRMKRWLIIWAANQPISQ